MGAAFPPSPWGCRDGSGPRGESSDFFGSLPCPAGSNCLPLRGDVDGFGRGFHPNPEFQFLKLLERASQAREHRSLRAGVASLVEHKSLEFDRVVVGLAVSHAGYRRGCGWGCQEASITSP